MSEDAGVWRYEVEGVVGPMGLAGFGRCAVGLDIEEALKRLPFEDEVDLNVLVILLRSIERGRVEGQNERSKQS